LGLLVKPVTEKSATKTVVYLGEKQVYYDYFSSHIYQGDQTNITVKAELHQIPLFIRGGSIIPTRERPRRSSPLMKLDPFTLRVALDNQSNARGELYLDDGETYAHEQGNIVWREFKAEASKKGKGITLRSLDLAAAHPGVAVDGKVPSEYKGTNDFATSISVVNVERIVILALGGKPTAVSIDRETFLEWNYHNGVAATGGKEGVASILTIENPGVLVSSDWNIVIE